jgi:hypothetical protein
MSQRECLARTIISTVKKTITHLPGFSEERVRKLFQDAGLVDFTMAHATSVKYDGLDIDFEIFIAKGVKPAATHITG